MNVLSAVHFTAEACKLINYNYCQELRCKIQYIFPVDHVYGSNDNALKLTEDEENDWHSLPTPEYSARTT